MTILFNSIPVGIRTPGAYIEIDNSRAVQGVVTAPHKILVIGQRLAAGTVAKETPTLISSAAQAEEAFGRGSMLAAMFAALKGANRHTESWGVALDDDAGGTAAAGQLSWTGPATAAGSIVLYVAGKRVTVAVADGDTADDVATAVAAAINGDTSLPVTAAVNGVDTFKVDVTARHKGEAGNDIDLRVNYYQGEVLPAGVGLTVTAMAAGATNPDVSLAIAAIGATQYKTVVMPYTDAANLTALETELDTRWGPMVMQEGHAFAAKAETHANLITFGDGRNNPHMTVMGFDDSPTPPWEWAAVVAGVDAAEPDPARPRQTLALPGVLAPPEAKRFTRDERDLLLNDGISTFLVGPGGEVSVERLITMYQVNPLAAPDPSYLDVTTLRTLAFLRETQRNRILLKFPRHKLANDGTLFDPGQAVVTPAIIRAELLALFREWEGMALVEGFDQFQTDLVVQRDGGDPNRVNVVTSPDIVNQLRVSAAAIRFLL